jgi:integrase/recombinase XerD
MLEYIPFSREERPLPLVLSQEDVTRLIEASSSLMHRAMLMTLYAAGLRRTEAANLKIADIDSKRMVIHVRQGKGRRDRDIPLSSKLLDVLRDYWRWMKPKTYLFPGTRNGLRADVPI